jgi:hypothetical protein
VHFVAISNQATGFSFRKQWSAHDRELWKSNSLHFGSGFYNYIVIVIVKNGSFFSSEMHGVWFSLFSVMAWCLLPEAETGSLITYCKCTSWLWLYWWIRVKYTLAGTYQQGCLILLLSDLFTALFVVFTVVTDVGDTALVHFVMKHLHHSLLKDVPAQFLRDTHATLCFLRLRNYICKWVFPILCFHKAIVNPWLLKNNFVAGK